MKTLTVIGQAIFEFIVTYLCVIAAMAVLPTFMAIVVNVISGNPQNLGMLITIFACTAALSSTMFYRHLKRENIISVKQNSGRKELFLKESM
jgi:hypothetical protein